MCTSLMMIINTHASWVLEFHNHFLLSQSCSGDDDVSEATELDMFDVRTVPVPSQNTSDCDGKSVLADIPLFLVIELIY